MQKRIKTAVVALLCAFAFVAGLQAETIPRRVFVEEPRIDAPAINQLDAAEQSILEGSSYMVFTLASSIQPAVLTEEKEKAHSIIGTEILGPAADAPTNNEGRRVHIRLKKPDGTIQEEASYILEAGDFSPDAYAEFLHAAARAFAPQLEEVEQKVEKSVEVRRERRKEMVEEIRFSDRMATPFQLSLWTSGLWKNFFSNNDDFKEYDDTALAAPLPVFLDLGWYFSRHFGLVGSVYFDRNSYMPIASYGTLGGEENLDEVTIEYNAETTNTLMLSGLGLGYRSLGRLFMEFNFLYYRGFMWVKAEEEIRHYTTESDALEENNYEPSLSLDKGETERFELSVISLQPAVGYALTPKWAMRVRLPLQILTNRNGIYPYMDPNMFYTYFMQLGLTYRF